MMLNIRMIMRTIKSIVDVVANQINRQDGNDEYLFTVGEIVVFRITYDLKFNVNAGYKKY